MSLKCHLVACATFLSSLLRREYQKPAVCITQSLQTEPGRQGGQTAGLDTIKLLLLGVSFPCHAEARSHINVLPSELQVLYEKSPFFRATCLKMDRHLTQAKIFWPQHTSMQKRFARSANPTKSSSQGLRGFTNMFTSWCLPTLALYRFLKEK